MRCFTGGSIFFSLEISFAWNLLILILTPFFMRFYALEPETKRLVFWMVLIHNVFNAAAFPFSGALSSGLRAAGDVKFTMYVSVASTVAGRLALSYLLGIVFDLGVIGLALAWLLTGVSVQSYLSGDRDQAFGKNIR